MIDFFGILGHLEQVNLSKICTSEFNSEEPRTETGDWKQEIQNWQRSKCLHSLTEWLNQYHATFSYAQGYEYM